MSLPIAGAAWHRTGPAHRLASLFASVALALGSGCLPSKLTLDLKPASRELAETMVLSDHEERSPDTSHKIALIDVRGLIADASSPGLIGSSPNPVDEFIARLDKARKDPAVRGVVLRVNSPGGTVTASDTMHREVRRFRETTGKPVVVCMSELCASGGYYLALAGDTLIAQPTTITASIGVIMQTINVSQGLAKIGVYARSVTSGPNKAMGSPFEPMQDAHYALMQGMVDEFYARFKGLVRERRPGVSDANLATSTDGRVVTGTEAARLGLVDRLGDLHDAFEEAKTLAGVTTARLMKYHNSGDAPRSPYAAQAPLTPASTDLFESSTTNLSLIELNMSAGLGLPLSPGFYYLWSPLLP